MSIVLVAILSVILVLMLVVPSLEQKKCIKNIDNAFRRFEDDDKEDDSLPENWLEEIETRIMGKLSEAKRSEAMPIVKASFNKIEKLLIEWRKMPELVNNYGDTERVFKIAMLNIERFCKEYANDECSFDSFREQVDKQIDGLKTIIKCLSDLAGCSRQP